MWRTLCCVLVVSALLSIVSCKNKYKHNEDSINDSLNFVIEDSVEIDSFLNASQAFRNDSDMFNAGISFYFYDDSLDTVVTELNPDLSLVPASTLKIITTSAALLYLGGGSSFSTRLQYDGTIEDGHILKGNIYIKGGGDAALGSRFYSGTYGAFIDNWANAVTELGIDTVTGYIIGDAGIFEDEYIPATWSWGEIGDYYCTGASGLTIYDNQYDLTFYSGRKVRTQATRSTITPYIPDFYYTNKASLITTEKLTIYLLGAPYSSERIIKGSFPSSAASYTVTGSIPDPPYLAAYELFEKLESKGVKIAHDPTTMRELKIEEDSVYSAIISNSRTTISTIWSPSVASLVLVTNLRSNNLFAEHLLVHIGLQYYGTGSTEAGAKAVKNLVESFGVDTRGMNIFDGSGVSRYNAVTSRQLVGVLKYMKDSSDYFETFYSSLPVAGEKGTLTGFCDSTAAHGKIAAKSGSMSRVRSYAGYIETNSGRNVIFAITVNNYNCTDLEIKQKIELFLEKFVEFR